MSNLWSVFILIVVLAHFVVGFGYLVFRLSPKKGRDLENSSTS